MNTSSLANTLLINIGLGPVASSRNTVKKGEPFTLPAAVEQHQSDASANASETAKTDNIPTDACLATEPTNEPPQDRGCSVDEQNEPPASGQDKTRPRANEQGLASNAVAAQPAVVQQWLATYSQNIEHGRQGLARKVGPKAGYELAQLLANLKIAEAAAGIGQAANANKNKPLAAENSTPVEENTALPNNAADVVGTEPEEVTVPEKPADSAVIAAQNFIEPELTTEDTSDASGSKESPEDGEAQQPKEASVGIKTTDNSSPQPLITDKTVVSEVLPKPFFTVAETTKDKPSVPQPPKAQINQEQTIPTEQKPAVNNLHAAQQDGNNKAQVSNLLGDFTPAKSNPEQVQVTAQQTKNHGDLPFDNGSNSQTAQQPLSGGNLQSSTTAQATASAMAAKTPNNAFADNAFNSVGEQIQQYIHSSVRKGDQQITVHLNPPELGRVFIRLQEQSDQITGLLEVSKAQTRLEIQQALPQIIQHLAESGIQVKRLEVVLTDQSGQQAYKDQSMATGQENWSGQQAPANPDPQGNGFGFFAREQWLTSLDSYSGFTEIQEQLVTDGVLNLLI
jgi:flagellar hook-length control protein FliK